MNKPLSPAARENDGDGRHAPRAAMTLTPVYRWLIMLNPVLGAAGLALNLAARGH